MSDLSADYQIRSATNADSLQVRELVYTILEEYGMSPDPEHADKSLKDIEASFENGSFEVLLGPDGEIVGTVGVLFLNEQTCELTKMFLDRRHRGNGLGKFLLERAITFARSSGFKVMELETATALKEAVKLYETFGFQDHEKSNSVARCNKVMTLTL